MTSNIIPTHTGSSSRSHWLQDKDNERTESPNGSADGTKYYSFGQRESQEESESRKRAQPTSNQESRKIAKTSTSTQRQSEPYIPDPAQFDQHKKAWGYLQALVPDYPSGYLERQSYDSAKRTGYLIGRAQGSDFRCEKKEISKQHCLIYMENGSNGVEKGISVYLEDLSSNGTYVNGQVIGSGKRVLLRSADSIQLVRRSKYDDDHVTNQFYRIILPPQFEVGTFYEEYDIGEVLGRGNFAKVYKATQKGTTQAVAVKMISKSRFDRRPKMLPSVIQEIGILMSLEAHPCVIQICKVYNEPKYLYLLLEYVEGGELFDYVVRRKKLSEPETRFVFLQLFCAIELLHSKGIAHRDLKPENILLVNKDRLHIKITDFGLAKMQNGQSPFLSQCGTPNYVAPEILDPSSVRAYGKECDLWSLGVMLYICLCGFPPFNEEVGPPPMKEQIKRGLYEFPDAYWSSISDEAKDLVKCLLTVDPAKRITVKEALNHAWMKKEVNKHPKEKECFSHFLLKYMIRLVARIVG
ncbi:kinase-like domain-containing protein [Phascolomyces articulosus]|uniref:Kinase-like domain-containing protein n=1 Tax=Phascolomyces articulosus TaxID=60185 RepID=A0AAD5PAQ2_9FUNG|nr:kinase-like domain-containing protein [Phascolomyces articulosus]